MPNPKPSLNCCQGVELQGETLIELNEGLKSIAKAGTQEGYKFDKEELGSTLNDAALTFLMGMDGEQAQRDQFVVAN